MLNSYKLNLRKLLGGTILGAGLLGVQGNAYAADCAYPAAGASVTLTTECTITQGLNRSTFSYGISLTNPNHFVTNDNTTVVFNGANEPFGLATFASGTGHFNLINNAARVIAGDNAIGIGLNGGPTINSMGLA